MIIRGYEALELSTQVVIKEALNRGIQVDVLDWRDNFIRLKKNDKIEYVKQATRTSADTYISPLIMENKEVTKHILSENGINVPRGITITAVDEALEHFDSLKNKNIVVKPKSTNFGKGVIILKPLDLSESLKNAVAYALQYDNEVMIEEFIEGKEYRFLVIGHKVAAVLHRVPANVKGDGQSTIEQLVMTKNEDVLRGEGYITPLEKIKLGSVEKDFLKLQGKGITYIPQNGETVFLRENSNISTGGDSIDFTDEISEAYKLIAVNAAKAVGAKICGADIIIRDIEENPEAENYSIIELNFNPALHIHDFPFKGKNRHVEATVLDLLGL